MNKQVLVVFLFALVFLLFMSTSVLATPTGASITEEKSETAPADTPGPRNATAGNVTELTVSGISTTQSWQGYFGNVSGTIQLADASDNVMYNWSQASAEGEIYAANDSSVSWSNIGCFNFSAGGGELNLSILESQFNISADDVDGVDETFNLNNHAPFSTGTTSFASGVCNNTKLFNNVGAATFDVALLYDDSNNIPVFVSILTDNTAGFDSDYHDFEMIVLEDGHSGDSSVTPYYFYVELNA